MWKRVRSAALVAAIILSGCAAVGIIIGEQVFHVPDRFRPEPGRYWTAGMGAARTRNVSVGSFDGGTLRGTLAYPEHPHGGGVLLMHGVADSRKGTWLQARLLLRHGYTVLSPDGRGHGASGGDLVTYGVWERRDVLAWLAFLAGEIGTQRLYAIGNSLGGSVLLQSLTAEPPLRAVVAECAFDSFRLIATDRLGSQVGLNSALSRFVFAPFVTPAFVYAQMRYGFDLAEAEPLEAVRNTQIPILLIHGTGDRQTYPEHSRRLHQANARMTELWEPASGHVDAAARFPEEYEKRVTAWLARWP